MAKHLQPGTEVHSNQNTYIIRSVLGSGGFGITYSATYATKINGMRVKVVVALKEFFLSADCEREEETGSVSVSTPGRERVEQAKKDFIGEARRLRALSGAHHNIINVSEVFEDNNTAYYVMEYVEGMSLDAYVKERGALSEAETLTVMRPIVDAVAFLHRNRMTHLDIKPGNIMLSTDDDGRMRPVLIDFGLSKHYNADGTPTSTLNSMGYSDGYSPIEQYAGIREFSPASDVYSLGATMLYCLTGNRPYRAVDVNIDSVGNTLRIKGVTENTVQAIHVAMQLRVANRPADASLLYMMLEEARLSYESTRVASTKTEATLKPVHRGRTELPNLVTRAPIESGKARVKVTPIPESSNAKEGSMPKAMKWTLFSSSVIASAIIAVATYFEGIGGKMAGLEWVISADVEFGICKLFVIFAMFAPLITACFVLKNDRGKVSIGFFSCLLFCLLALISIPEEWPLMLSGKIVMGLYFIICLLAWFSSLPSITKRRSMQR